MPMISIDIEFRKVIPKIEIAEPEKQQPIYTSELVRTSELVTAILKEIKKAD